MENIKIYAIDCICPELSGAKDGIAPNNISELEKKARVLPLDEKGIFLAIVECTSQASQNTKNREEIGSIEFFTGFYNNKSPFTTSYHPLTGHLVSKVNLERYNPDIESEIKKYFELADYAEYKNGAILVSRKLISLATKTLEHMQIKSDLV